VNDREYEVLIKRVRNSEDAKKFLPFYKEVIRPILENSVTIVLSGDTELSDRRLLEIRAFAKTIKDIEVILNRILVMGESANKVMQEQVANG
jgi:hypothetical protein